jgi:hypothetical protein
VDSYELLVSCGLVERSDVLFFDNTIVEHDSHFLLDSSSVKENGLLEIVLDKESDITKIQHKVNKQHLAEQQLEDPELEAQLRAEDGSEDEIVGGLEAKESEMNI